MRPVHSFDGLRSVLCIGAHPDDVELGCGGTLHHLHQNHPVVEFTVVVMTGSTERAAEAKEAAARFCGPDSRVHVLGQRDGYLPYEGAAAKDELRELAADLDPDIVFTHRRDDLHQDHSFVSDLTGQLFRNHLVLEYEIPKYDGDLGTCNTYVHLSETDAEAKVTGILDVFATQRSKYWMRADVLRATLRLRGVESRAPDLLAEGFVARKLVLT
ncbi:MAG: PIG-L family deacetylase [Acidimicrobiia bacterium]|nr:PIG-L family deacetylase [Acidimicrobiia bacterium]